MTERIRELLDEAVAGAAPRVADPVPDLVRRGRARQRQLAVAGTAAVMVAVLTAGGIVTANLNRSDDAPASQPSQPASGEKTATPDRIDPTEADRIAATVAGGVVRTGGLAVGIPHGWHVIQDRKITYCDIPAQSVLINVMQISGRDCNVHPQLTLTPWRAEALPPMVSGLGVINEVILPGGQPVWLDAGELKHLRSLLTKPGDPVMDAGLSMPWVGVRLFVEARKSRIAAVLRGVTAEPVTPARLALPERPTAVQLNLGEREQLATTDQATTDAVVRLLAGLDQPVHDGELPCAGAEQVTDTWHLAGTEMAGLTFQGPMGVSSATIAISTGPTCAFATSSRGGRVHLPAGFLAELRKLLGGRR